ncbi:SpvB/TcaC N-terminal domain-containing protein [Flavivirga algicola]|uniref:Insecticidal toxin complex protein n=1 Tax=Flavivirga algicola TaxID=2729136 RepID=A0ABX1S247_9FLAO|nr:SpvB/TcaC N-terminal domain-containing protein [Flavivirga algicola]NMH88794.1 insecticidal toxin complex protein [Flavivirga algicola]
MQNQDRNNTNKDLLKTNGGKTKSIAIEIPSISLPKGGGAISGIDEKFSVNAINGTASFSVPLPLSPSRGVSPSLNLSYNSGAGNGIFGLGWSLDLPSIKRKTDKGLPQYLDAIDSDTFLFSGTEDLIPEFRKLNDGSFKTDDEGAYIIKEKNSSDKLFVIRNYIPRIEGNYDRIERWTEKSTGRIKWKVTTGENVTTLFGWTDNSIISNPEDPTKIFEWLPEFVFDDTGNCSQYIYKKEDKTGFDHGLLHNRNRYKENEITFTNTYLEKVLYGNKTPYYFPNDACPAKSDYLFSIILDYGTLGPDESPETLKNWDYRWDAFSNYKAGFEIRTTRLCKRVLLFHHFKNENEYEGLVKSLDFVYNTDTDSPFAFLEKICSKGYIKKADGTYSSKELPPLQFEYQQPNWHDEIKTISDDTMIHTPTDSEYRKYQFVDLYSEGLSGILTEQANSWYYKRNLGGGNFEQAKMISPMPSLAGMGSSMQLVDLNGDGRKQFASFDSHTPGYFELDEESEWQGMRSFTSIPNIDFGNENTRLLDLDGDGKPEIVISEDHVLTWYPSEGRNGFSAARKTAKPFDEEEGPHVVFADARQTIHFSDMTGDGMTDIVRIRNGEVCYWPNLGYGKFGSKVTLDNAPTFDNPDCFNPSFLRLADIDGSGTSDIVYLGKNQLTCWKNMSGNSLCAAPFKIESLPEVHDQSNISVIDLLGDGVACIVWSNSLSKEANAPLKYIDLMQGKKPYILTKYVNNMGKEVSMEYTPSTKFYLDDKLAGQPWVTKLHFPIQCVSKTLIKDKISGHQFVSEYKYHHGYYDHAEREFRGFGMIEQLDTESFEHWVRGDASNIVEEPLHQEPVVTKTWNHTGAFLQRDKILSQYAKDHWYEALEREGFTTTHHEAPLPDARLVATSGIDPEILNLLSKQELQEAQRACKGIRLRSEVFTKDINKSINSVKFRRQELTPFSVTAQNYIIELLQPKGHNKHAVFTVKESEEIIYTYERNPEDPRITHTLNIKTDTYGNVLESAKIVYPRKKAEITLPYKTQLQQEKTVLTYTENIFTNDAIGDEAYRLRLPSEEKTFELQGVSKTNTYYTINDFIDILTNERSRVIPYHEMNNPHTSDKAGRRLIEHTRSIYYCNDLAGPLPLHELESLALSFENYQLAYTPALLTDIFDDKANNALMSEGKFTNSEGDDNWWVRSGITQFKLASENQTDAKNRFYAPISYTDPYGATTQVAYYGDYFLFIQSTTNALGNTSSASNFNFRTLTPQQVRDHNGNLSEVISDELGFVKAMAFMGKGDEADELTGLTETTDTAELNSTNSFFEASNSEKLTLIGKKLLNCASSRFVYNLDAYSFSGSPIVTTTIKREQHFKQQSDSPIQISFEYTNGMGEVIMKKTQAEPGKAKQVLVNPDNTITVTEVDTSMLEPKQLRWIGNGRIIKNNKGSEVKQYEPYFSVTHHYEDFKELVETGVTPIFYYDGLDRLEKAEMPDGTFMKVEFNSWKQTVFDTADTILESPWYHDRTNRLIDAKLLKEGKNPIREKQAADSAAIHANTPNSMCFDTLGRPILSIDHYRNSINGMEEQHYTEIELDVEGNLRAVTDARGNSVIQYKYDMLGNLVYQKCADAGQRWLLSNILDNPLRTWDERDHEIQYFYDIMSRPTYSKVINTVGNSGDSLLNNIFNRIIYGENLLTEDRSNETELQARNVLGKVVQHYDTAGLLDTPEYDFKGQPRFTTRKLFSKYKETVDWTQANLGKNLEPTNGFTTVTKTDAIGRTTQQTAPDGSTTISSYNRSGLLNGQSVLQLGSEIASPHILSIDYNEKGQRNKIIYGNNVSTRFYYDRETFRLKRLESKRLNGDPLQDWYYTYDPIGNITHIEDKNVPVNFFNNQKVTGISTYIYDSLYRLIEATGRENDAALSFNSCDNWNDKPFMHALSPGDPMAVRNYTRRYQYDPVGNIVEMKHRAEGGNWTRAYTYETVNNRLKSTQIGDNSNPATYTKYTHHEKHGFLTALPHLETIKWNFKEEVMLTSRQRCTHDNIPVITYYQYDGNGKRIRKITENQTAEGGIPSKKEERIYLGAYELYKKYSNPHRGLERTSLNLSDQGHRFATIETRNNVDDGTERRLTRYQLHNHLGSCSMELDGTLKANIISYEEYHPYGTTAYQAKNTAIRSAAKRYRYTGMERDEETGLEYHSARYYIPWLGRWLSCDPLLSEPQNSDKDSNTDNKNKKNKNSQNTLSDGVDTSNSYTSTDICYGNDCDPSAAMKQLHEHQRSHSKQQPQEVTESRDGMSNLKNLNLYAYGASNPIIYTDPSGNVPIIQAWWDGYSNASDAGKVGYGFLFILAWLAHVIVNLVVLVLAVTILNPGGLFGAWDFTWGAPQSILGLGAGIVLTLLGADVRPRWGLGAIVEMPAYMGNPGGMSLGPVVLGGHGFSDYPHEFGHTWQSRLLGPLYLLIIGIPSLISAIVDPGNHSNFYTEKWADAWAT